MRSSLGTSSTERSRPAATTPSSRTRHICDRADDAWARSAYGGAMRCVSRLVTVILVVAATTAWTAAARRSTQGPTAALSFEPTALAQFNGTAPHLDAATICGSNTETFLTELLHTSPFEVKVNKEWADIVPGGKQVAVDGPARTTHLGPTDLPLTHIYGDDLSMDIGLAPSLQQFAQHLGPSNELTDEIHVEISSGLIPHARAASHASPTQTWRQASD